MTAPAALIWYLVALGVHDVAGNPVGIGPFAEESCRKAVEVLAGPAVQLTCRKVVAFRADSFDYRPNGPWARTVPVFEGDPAFVPTGSH